MNKVQLEFTDLLSCSLREFSRRKLRVIGNLTGYIIAISLMVFLGNFLLFSKAAEEAILKKTGTVFLAFVPTKIEEKSENINNLPIPISKNEGFVANSILTKPIPLDLIKKIQSLAHVKSVYPYLLFRFQDPVDGHFFSVGGFELVPGNVANATMTGALLKDRCCPTTVDNTKTAEEEIIKGRPIKAHNEVLIEESYAVNRNIDVGAELTIAGKIFKVVAIIKPGVRPAKADIYMAWPAAEEVINTRLNMPLNRQTNLFVVEVDDVKNQADTIKLVKERIEGSAITTYNCFQNAVKVLGINENAVLLLIIVLSIGAILLSLKSQVASLLERKRDIGILKAIGWTDRAISTQLVVESLLQAITGGTIGCIIGSVLFSILPIQKWADVTTSLKPSLVPWLVLASLAIAIIGGLIAGLIPARTALKQRPIEAFRSI